ncbi:MAG: RteC domain-containing protein [Deltaproteobacteria bacterium]|nr:RteC domain-containing protein [Deltaproteobacteria bacterium]
MIKKKDPLNKLFNALYNNSIGKNEAILQLQKLTDDFHDTNIEGVLDDLDTFRLSIRLSQLENVKEVKNSTRYKWMVQNGEQIPYLDLRDALKSAGKFYNLEASAMHHESVRFVELFFPDVKRKLDDLTLWIHHVIITKGSKHWKKKLPSIETNVLTDSSHLNLQWQGEPIELVELIKSLIEAEKLSPNWTESAIFNYFERLFSIPLNPTDRLKTIKQRVHTANSIIPQLENAMNEWTSKTAQNVKKC